MATPTLDRALPQRSRPRYARTGILGMGLIAATVAVFLVLALLRVPEEVVFIGPLFAVALIATGLLWRFDATWSRILGIVVTLGLALMTFWVAFGLAFPSSFFDFVPAVMFVSGVVLSLFGNIAAIVQRRRGHLDAKAVPAERRLEQVAAGVVLVAVVVSGLLAITQRTSVDEAVAAGAVSVEMSDFAFVPEVIEAAAGEQLLVHNGDPFIHDIAIPELGIDAISVTPGSDVLVDVPGTSGSYVVYCTLHSDTDDPAPQPDEQMVATLTIR